MADFERHTLCFYGKHELALMPGSCGLTVAAIRLSDLCENRRTEMLTRLYSYSWIFLVAAFLLLMVVGSMTMTNLVVFGFIAFGMVFMGMIAVLPASISHPIKISEPEAVNVVPKPLKESVGHGVQTLRA